MAPLIVSISAARQTLFDLFETVTGHRGRKIVISSRGNRNRAVLVGEDYLSELEAAATRLRNIESANMQTAHDFKLDGSLRIATMIDDPLAEVRADANARGEKKLASFGK